MVNKINWIINKGFLFKSLYLTKDLNVIIFNINIYIWDVAQEACIDNNKGSLDTRKFED